MPFAAMRARTSPATWRSSRVTCWLFPVKRATSAGSCVATPSVQPCRRLPVVSPGCGPARWHWRSIEQPTAISSEVPKPTRSAPSSISLSACSPVRTPPSTLTSTRSRTPSSTSMSCTAGSTAGTGTPPCFWSTRLAAPVPPQPSERWRRLAPALTPPMQAISTPWVATNLSAAFTSGLRWRQLSTMSLTSSIE